MVRDEEGGERDVELDVDAMSVRRRCACGAK